MAYLPKAEALRMADLLAKEIIRAAVPAPKPPPPPPPAVPVPPEGLDKLIMDFNTGKISLEEYRRKARELRK